MSPLRPLFLVAVLAAKGLAAPLKVDFSLASFTFTVTDAQGDTMTRTINVRVQ